MQTWWRGANELDEHQQKIMDLPSDGSFAITGPPGSGKTNLLLMRGAYLSSLSRNIAVLVMNRTLAEFIKTGAAGYGISPDSVMTSKQFIGALAAENGTPLKRGLMWEEGRVDATEALRQIVRAKGRPIYDTILIDEAQDHNEEELALLKQLARDIYLTADARQLIYETGSADDRFSELVQAHHELPYHYRSAPEICDLADLIGDTYTKPYVRIAPTCRYPVTSPKGEVQVKTATLAEQGTLVAARLPLQLRAFRGELIGIFTPNRRDAGQLAEILAAAGFGDQMTVQVGEGYMEIKPDRPICISTVHGAKGLEFRAVHFCAAETVKSHGKTQKRVAFTAVTRAKTSLTVYHDQALPPYLQTAVARWREPAADAPNWRSIFNGN